MRYESYAAAEIARLDERRLACLGGRIDAQLSLGRSERVLDELAALVVEHPLRESFRLQLVRALRDSGRGAEALAAYRGAPGDSGSERRDAARRTATGGVRRGGRAAEPRRRAPGPRSAR